MPAQHQIHFEMHMRARLVQSFTGMSHHAELVALLNALAGADLNNDLVLNDRLPFRGRNDFTGPDYFQVDLRLSRRFRFSTASSIEVMVESENLFNRLNASCSIAGCTSAVVNRDGAADFQSAFPYHAERSAAVDELNIETHRVESFGVRRGDVRVQQNRIASERIAARSAVEDDGLNAEVLEVVSIALV